MRSSHSKSHMTSPPRSQGFFSDEPGIEVDVGNIIKSTLWPRNFVFTSDSLNV